MVPKRDICGTVNSDMPKRKGKVILLIEKRESCCPKKKRQIIVCWVCDEVKTNLVFVTSVFISLHINQCVYPYKMCLHRLLFKMCISIYNVCIHIKMLVDRL